jgi:hypothetical protein
VFTARYGLGPYIKQTRLLFKDLNNDTSWRLLKTLLSSADT